MWDDGPESAEEAEELRAALRDCLLYADMYYLRTGDTGARQAVLKASLVLKPKQWRVNPIGD